MTKKLRLNEQSALFLKIVTCASVADPVCGTDIVARSNSQIPIGSVYAIATILEMDGYIESQREEIGERGGIPRRFYKINADGKLILKTWQKLNANSQGNGKLEDFLPEPIGSPALI